MLDVLKFTWQNGNGYWIPAAWITVPTSATDVRQNHPSTVASLREYASHGRPNMTGFKVLDRATIPEDLRLNGRSFTLMAMVILHDRNANDYDAEQMVGAMVAQTA